jgi:hypothetical protein
MDWDTLIAERNEWVARNFPENKCGVYPNGVSFDTVFGVFEEAGELTHSHLKEAQSVRGTDEEHQAAAQDAIGDCTIYLLGVMSKVGKPQAVPVYSHGSASIHHTLQQLGREVGTLMTSPSRYNVEQIVYWLRRYCQFREWDYEQIVQETWDRVKQRDWIADPMSGGESA